MFTLKNLLWLAITLVSESFSYVFDVNYVYKYETNNTGYTAVLLQKQQDSFRLVAGAPKDDTVAICNAKTCQSYTFSERNPAGIELLGTAIDGGNNADDPLYVCAPRFIISQQYRANGRCFAWNDGFKTIKSLSNPLLQVQLYNSTYEFLYAHGQAGFSIKYINGTEFIIGAPGVLSWKGTVIKHTTYDSKDILNVEKKIERHSYLGYAIEYGEYQLGKRKTRCVIAGAPRGYDLRGLILKPQKSRRPLGDIDLGKEDSGDQTAAINKSGRRVSFASNNFVKPFVADPEKNTIWDLTYEEAIEKSDTPSSVHCSHRENENDCNRLNVTLVASDDTMWDLDLTPPVDGIMEEEVRSKSMADGMEFTTAVTNMLVCDVNENVNEEEIADNMEFTKRMDNSNVNAFTMEKTNLFEDNMEFTVPIKMDLNPITIRPENANLFPEQTCDDTENLINLDLSNEKVSDFTKVINGDLVPYFQNLPGMPLRGINSTSFVEECLNGVKPRSSVIDMDISYPYNVGVTPEILVISPTNRSDVQDVVCGDINICKDDVEIRCNDPTDAGFKVIGSCSTATPVTIDSNINIKDENLRSTSGEIRDLDKRKPEGTPPTNISDVQNVVCADMNICKDDVEIRCNDPMDAGFKVTGNCPTATSFTIASNIEIEDENLGSTSDEISDLEKRKPEENYNIIELCTKLSMENTSLLCDTSAISIPNSSITEASPDTPNSTHNETFNTKFTFNLDDLPSIDLSPLHDILKKSRDLIEMNKKVSNDINKRLDKDKNRCLRYLGDYDRKVKLLDEFNALMLKTEEILNFDFAKISRDEPECVSWKEKVLELFERNEGSWNFTSLDSNPCAFTTLYGTICLKVNIDQDNGEVTEVQLEKHISDKSEPIALYIHKIFMEKLKLKHIQSALGEKFEILSLLDYIRLTMGKLLELDDDYLSLAKTYAVTMDKEFKIYFALISVKQMFNWRFTIDVTDYYNINKDMVSYYAKIGNLRERDIQKCLNACPQGFGFVRAFIEALYALLRV